ncbi:MAG: single-stranded-DNA-specific exonuclease RecJ [Fimbriimonadaceae bacterium]|nr:single-stranded-DNA-specific exonuclease RecJ [Fimbriimonadaceae bacterium]
MGSMHGASMRWEMPDVDAETVNRLAREVGVPRLVAEVLVRRGYDDQVGAATFLHPSLGALHDPRLLPDYDAAVSCLLSAKEQGKRVFVHGDYDVDGVTSAALLYRFLKGRGFEVDVFVPHRMKQGFGIHSDSVDAARELGAGLFLSCDCGTAAVVQVAKAREYGMDVVVTDHHEVSGDLPPANAVVNPHRADSVYPFSELSGVGVAFKLCAGLSLEMGLPLDRYYNAYLDLAALGTVVDVMPLVGENRIITRFGLPLIKETRKVGLRALIAEYAKTVRGGQLQAISVKDLSFGLGPRLNAAGRVDDASHALQLLITEDASEAHALATRIEEMNRARKAEQDAMIEAAAQRIRDEGLDEGNVIVLLDKSWHPGIVGIVAGKLVEQFRRPCFVGTFDPETGKAKASARTIPAFNLAQAIERHAHLVQGGGHAMAAGISFEFAQLDSFRAEMDAYAATFLSPEDFVPSIRLDAAIEPGELTAPVVHSLEALQPFGMGNPGPHFVARGVTVRELRPTRAEHILQVTIEEPGGKRVNAVTFDQADLLRKVDPGTRLDVVVRAEIDDFRNDGSVKWTIKDFAPVS